MDGTTTNTQESSVGPSDDAGDAPDQTEVMRHYLAAVHNRQYVSLADQRELTTRLALQGTADQAVSETSADVAHKQAMIADCEARLTEAEATIANNADIEAAAELVTGRSVAEARLIAARNMLRQSLDFQRVAGARAQAAARAVRDVAERILSAQLREKVRRFMTHEPEWLEILGWLQVVPGALSPQEKLALYSSRTSAVALGMPPPDMDIPLDQLRHPLTAEDDLRAARAQMERAAASMQGRFDALLRGELETVSATDETEV